MSRVINTVAYSLQGTGDGSAVYGAIVSSVPTTVRFQSLAAKQGGVAGIRTSRVVTQTVTLTDGSKVPVVETHTSFLPLAASAADAIASRGILKALMEETSYDAGIANKSVE